MKLYLSSYRIPDTAALQKLLGKPFAKASVALIPNAKDYYAPRARRVKIRSIVEYLELCNFTVSVVDLNYYTDAALLAAELKKYDMLWVMGGNSFCLREAMQRSGFDRVVGELVDQGVVYAGESAGACVAGSDLKGIDLADDDEFAEMVIWDGLHLTEHYVVPHADNKDFGPIIQKIMETRTGGPEMVVLNDNQAWVVNGADERKVTGTVYGPEESA